MYRMGNTASADGTSHKHLDIHSAGFISSSCAAGFHSPLTRPHASVRLPTYKQMKLTPRWHTGRRECRHVSPALQRVRERAHVCACVCVFVHRGSSVRRHCAFRSFGVIASPETPLSTHTHTHFHSCPWSLLAESLCRSSASDLRFCCLGTGLWSPERQQKGSR